MFASINPNQESKCLQASIQIKNPNAAITELSNFTIQLNFSRTIEPITVKSKHGCCYGNTSYPWTKASNVSV